MNFYFFYFDQHNSQFIKYMHQVKQGYVNKRNAT